MKKYILAAFCVLGFAAATQASAAITVGSGSIAGGGDISLQPSSGNVGIGTTTPGAKLHVSGGTSQFEGNISVGAYSPSSSAMVYVRKGGTMSSGTTGLDIDMDVTPTCACSPSGISSVLFTNGSQSPYGFRNADFQMFANHTGTLNNIRGINVYTGVNGPSLTTTAYGILSYLWLNTSTTTAYGLKLDSDVSGGTTGSFYGAYISAPTSAGTITNSYGLYLEGYTHGTNNVGIVIGETTGTKQTNILVGTTTQPSGSYSIYNSSTDPNYFAGALAIGVVTATTGSKLEVKDGHIASTQTTAPTPSVTGSGYSGASLAATSTDTKGAITATVGAAAGTLVVTFQTGYSTAPHCAVTAGTATAQVDSGKMYITTSTSALTLNFVATPTGGSETWHYICMQ